VKLKVRVLDKVNARLPQYTTKCASGMDLSVIEEVVVMQPGQRRRFPFGIALEIPEGYEAQIRPRSSLGQRDGVFCDFATIDQDYRGEIGALLVHLGNFPKIFRRGERIAQLVIAPVVRAELDVVEELSPTLRGAGGLGHTGRF
jgi:dUTP pyrophosphatase